MSDPISLNDIRKKMAAYMTDHPTGSLDSAIFYAMKEVYAAGYKAGLSAVTAHVEDYMTENKRLRKIIEDMTPVYIACMAAQGA